jgi:U3 small nucleolar RNA-associated protein 22
MSRLPAKRRKLDHPDHDRSDGSPGSALGSGLENSDEEDASKVDAPAAKSKPTPPPKRTKDNDGSALYAGGLYKSSMFKLQVDEMLAEVRPNYGEKFSGADDALRQLKGLIEAIEGRAALSVSSPLVHSQYHN